MRAELVKYRLRQSTQAGKRTDVLGMVQVSHRGENTHYAYIKFSEEFVNFVGSVLPYGVGPGLTAFISVDKEGTQDSPGLWNVYAGYWDKPEKSRVLLWTTTEMPKWLKLYKLKRPKNGNPSPSPGTTK